MFCKVIRNFLHIKFRIKKFLAFGQLLDVVDYISNSFLMPFISLLTSILIGWVIGPDWIIGEVERNGEHFKRAGLYRFMIRYVVPFVMFILFLVSTGFADLIS